MIRSKKINVVYIDIRHDKSYLDLLKSLKTSSVPAVFKLTKDGKIEFISHIITQKIIEKEFPKKGLKNSIKASRKPHANK